MDFVADFGNFRKFMSSKPHDEDLNELHTVVKNIFQTCLIQNSPELRKLSTQVVGHASSDASQPKRGPKFVQRIHGAENDSPAEGALNIPSNFDNSDGYLITDMEEFKNSMELYPNDPSDE